MFSDKVLEKIFSIPDMQKLPLEKQSNIIHEIESILRNEDYVKGDNKNVTNK